MDNQQTPSYSFSTRDYPYFARLEAAVTNPDFGKDWNNSERYPAEENWVVHTEKLLEGDDEFNKLVSWLSLAIQRAIVLNSVSEHVDADHEWTLYVRPCSATKSFFDIFPHYFLHPYEFLARLDGPADQQEIERKAKDIAWELRYRTEELLEDPGAAPAAFVLSAVEDYDLFLGAVKEHGISFLQPYCSLRWSEQKRK